MSTCCVLPTFFFGLQCAFRCSAVYPVHLHVILNSVSVVYTFTCMYMCIIWEVVIPDQCGQNTVITILALNFHNFCGLTIFNYFTIKCRTIKMLHHSIMRQKITWATMWKGTLSNFQMLVFNCSSFHHFVEEVNEIWYLRSLIIALSGY